MMGFTGHIVWEIRRARKLLVSLDIDMTITMGDFS